MAAAPLARSARCARPRSPNSAGGPGHRRAVQPRHPRDDLRALRGVRRRRRRRSSASGSARARGGAASARAAARPPVPDVRMPTPPRASDLRLACPDRSWPSWPSACWLARRAAASGRCRARPSRRGYSTLPEFPWSSGRAAPSTLGDLRGRPWIADFIFTRCGGVCPAMTARMAASARASSPRHDVRFVSFTVDPAHDTPEVLARYAAACRRRRGLAVRHRAADATCTRSRSTASSWPRMEVAAGEREPGGDGPFLHSSKFVLVDGEGVIRGLLRQHGRGRAARPGGGRAPPGARGDRPRPARPSTPSSTRTSGRAPRSPATCSSARAAARRTAARCWPRSPARPCSSCRYLVYHFHVGSVRFQGQGPIRTVYFTILLTHTDPGRRHRAPGADHRCSHGLRERFDRHRRHRPGHAAPLGLRLRHGRGHLLDAVPAVVVARGGSDVTCRHGSARASVSPRAASPRSGVA